MDDKSVRKHAYAEFRRWLEKTRGDQYHEKLTDIKDNPESFFESRFYKISQRYDLQPQEKTECRYNQHRHQNKNDMHNRLLLYIKICSKLLQIDR